MVTEHDCIDNDFQMDSPSSAISEGLFRVDFSYRNLVSEDGD